MKKESSADSGGPQIILDADSGPHQSAGTGDTDPEVFAGSVPL
jgi:hypothetical protein